MRKKATKQMVGVLVVLKVVVEVAVEYSRFAWDGRREIADLVSAPAAGPRTDPTGPRREKAVEVMGTRAEKAREPIAASILGSCWNGCLWLWREVVDDDDDVKEKVQLEFEE
jgi:hypothetical protein